MQWVFDVRSELNRSLLSGLGAKGFGRFRQELYGISCPVVECFPLVKNKRVADLLVIDLLTPREEGCIE